MQPAPIRRPAEIDLTPLRDLVAIAFPESAGDFECEPMLGGASTRRYFRLRMRSGTAVAMFVPEGERSEEVVKTGAVHGRWPFLEVRDLLVARGIDVPALYGEATALGWILLEDLGDQTLAAYLLVHPEQRETLYVRAVSDLARAQARLLNLPEASVVRSRAFDEELLSWEIQHFRQWGLEARGIVLDREDRMLFDRVAQGLASTIAGLPRGFVHRDYQSRNLMVRTGGALCWIDFQDALLGPWVYDLVALLNDSYQIFDRAFVEARLDDYARAAGLGPHDRAGLGRDFDRVTVHRKLKDAGRFVYIDRAKGNDSFLKFVQPTIEKAMASLSRLSDEDEMRNLRGVLSRVLSR
jgi:aminoglycoside/choline kinase family phosphotransferase